MEKDNKIDEKLTLIFEFNNNSPLFARVAEAELRKGNFEHAVQILENGTKKFPDYPTGHIIHALATAYIGKLSKAKQILSKAFDLLDSDEGFDYYVKLLEEIVFKKKRFTEIRGASFVSNDISDEEIENEKEPVSTESEKPEPTVGDSIDDNLEKLAEELSKAKIKIADKETEETFDNFDSSGEQIVSETMAGIYYSQKNYSEAISLYEKLKEIKPEKAELYQKKIDEIKDFLRSEE